VVTEAGRAPDSTQALGALASWVAAGAPPTTDLAWATITPWRQLLSQVLDPDALDRLRSGTSHAIVAYPGERPTMEALLFSGWLLDLIGHNLEIALLGDPGSREGGISSLEMESSPHRRLEVTRTAERATARVVAASPGSTRRREARQVHRIEGELEPRLAAERGEQGLRASLPGSPVPVLDLMILGMGPDGHTASLFPGAPEPEETQRLMVPVHRPELPQPWRVTMTLPVLNAATRLLVLVGGREKAPMVARALAGDPEIPAGRLRDGEDVTWILTEDAASEL
jgi:hypothetical protein